jgi:hypothetical protein
MNVELEQYVLKLIGGSTPPVPLDGQTLEVLRSAGADRIMLSNTGAGIVLLRPSFPARRKAKRGAFFEALLQRTNADLVYGISKGEVFITDDDQALREIEIAKSEPIGNLRFVSIDDNLVVSDKTSEMSSSQELDKFRASVKKGFRGTQIVDGGRALSVAELQERGWESSAPS